MSPTQSGVVAVSNSQSSKLRLTLEPWGEQYDLNPGETVDVRYEGPAGGRMAIEVKEAEVVVYGWHDAVLSVEAGASR